jgi:Cep192 domain 4
MSVTRQLAFGKVAVDRTRTKNLKIRNTGRNTPLIISSAISSDPEYALTGAGTCGAVPVTVAPKRSCEMGVAFTPDTLGAHRATLTLNDNAPTSPQHVALSGTGVAKRHLRRDSGRSEGVLDQRDLVSRRP